MQSKSRTPAVQRSPVSTTSVSPQRQKATRAPDREKPWQAVTPSSFHRAHETAKLVEKMALARAWCLDVCSEHGAELAAAMCPDSPLQQLRFSVASPLAMRVARARIITAALEVIEARGWNQPWYFVTLMMPDWYFPLDQLEAADPKHIKLALLQRMKRLVGRDPSLGGGLLTGMLEVSLRLDDDDVPAGYQVHLHAIADAKMNRVVSSLRKHSFGRGAARVRKPFLGLPVRDGDMARRVGYVFKAQVRRQDPRGSHSTGEAGPAWEHELRPDLMPDVLLWLDRWKLADFAIVVGTERMRKALRMRW